MRTKTVSPDKLKNWRQSASRGEGGVAVIAGSFSILQPGNLLAIRRAKQLASELIVILEPSAKFRIEGMDNGNDQRTEFLSFIGDISAVCNPGDRADIIENLRPYVMVDCLSQPDSRALRKALRGNAERIEDIKPIPGCFTEDIWEAAQKNMTPVRIPQHITTATEPDLDKLSFWRRQGRKIATVNGCFDILHLGHAEMLAGARGKTDELIVLVNDDASVRAYKGEGRPVFPAEFRLQALASLEPVSLAIPFSGDNPLNMLAQVRPDLHIKGGTYERERVRAETELLESWGGRVEFRPLVEGYSTTRLVEG